MTKESIVWGRKTTVLPAQVQALNQYSPEVQEALNRAVDQVLASPRKLQLEVLGDFTVMGDAQDCQITGSNFKESHHLLAEIGRCQRRLGATYKVYGRVMVETRRPGERDMIEVATQQDIEERRYDLLRTETAWVVIKRR